MRPEPIRSAALTFDADGLPGSSVYGDIYHPRSGALAQARHVFLAGNALPERWRGRHRFVVLETGFGLGNNFLATWQAWRDDPQRAARLTYISIEQQPLSRAQLAQVHAGSDLAPLARELIDAWPPATHDLHRLAFAEGRVELLLAFGDVQTWLREIVADVDAIFLDGFAPALNPRMWDANVCKALGRLAAPEATLATWSVAGALRRDLLTAGFAVRLAPGQGGKREITLARYAPKVQPRRPVGRPRTAPGARRALIVGAGLAGCAAARALAEDGWQCTLIERADRIAAGASGNPAGLFHGIVHPGDGPHARFSRTASFHAAAAARAAVASGVAGSVEGLLRLEHRLAHADMQAVLATQGLPADYVQALSARQASDRAGMAVDRPCWFYPAGGWINPGGLARWFVAGAGADLRCDTAVARLDAVAGGWRLVDARGGLIGEAPVVVLANAAAVAALLPAFGPDRWPLESRRGQLSMAPADRLVLPAMPIAGNGYLLPRVADRAVFGATSQRDDTDAAVRRADHAANLAQLERLLGRPSGLEPDDLEGRTAWRCAASDRLPLIGPVPDLAMLTGRFDHPRLVPRLPGLHVFVGLGSRGLTWAALGGRILASQAGGAPAPVESSLLDAVDPSRFICRAARTSARPA